MPTKRGSDRSMGQQPPLKSKFRRQWQFQNRRKRPKWGNTHNESTVTFPFWPFPPILKQPSPPEFGFTTRNTNDSGYYWGATKKSSFIVFFLWRSVFKCFHFRLLLGGADICLCKYSQPPPVSRPLRLCFAIKRHVRLLSSPRNTD